MHATRSRGYLVHRDRVSGKVTREADTFTCGHCNAMVVIPHRARPADLGSHCKVCDKLVCPRCTAIGRCIPFERQLEASESRDRLRRQIAGLCT